MRLYHTIQNSAQLKMYALLVSGIFSWIFLDHGGPRATATAEGETVEGRQLVREEVSVE